MIKVIGFDADDTLWVNEPNYQETESAFCKIVNAWVSEEETSRELFATEMANLELYGFGAKGFMLSMIETAIRLSKGSIESEKLDQIIKLGKELLDKPVELLPGVSTLLDQLQGKYTIILATKGDLLDQERKLRKSELESYFHHIEIMSDKREENYLKLLNRLEIQPAEFLMVGNSMKSDIMPVLNIGGYGVHVPFHINWLHDLTDFVPENSKFAQITEISKLTELLENI
jgi:putative hydrolase of the HAD superfamily